MKTKSFLSSWTNFNLFQFDTRQERTSLTHLLLRHFEPMPNPETISILLDLSLRTFSSTKYIQREWDLTRSRQLILGFLLKFRWLFIQYSSYVSSPLQPACFTRLTILTSLYICYNLWFIRLRHIPSSNSAVKRYREN